MKRIICIMLSGLMLLSMSACTDGGNGTGTTTPDTLNIPSSSQPASDSTSDTGADTTSETAIETTTETTTETTAPEITTPEPLVARDTSKTYRVLLIGNSFTYYNDMNKPNGIFYKIATNAGYNVTVDSVYKGGYYLHQYLDENDEYGKQVLQRLTTGIRYDIVVLQDQSAVPISNPADFYDACRRFKTLIDANGAEMWLYETWGYKAGQKNLSSFGRDTFDMEMKLRAAYTAIGEELGVPVAYVGAAFSRMYADHPEIEIYHSDLKHPGAMGSYLIAWTLFGTIFGVDPATLEFGGILPKSYADPLRAAASEIVRNGAPVPESYRKSSAGVGTK